MSGDSGAASSSNDLLARNVCHCGKGFIRKEHLRRHQATHGEKAHVCHICQRSFSRSDMLRRHVSRHAVAPSPAAEHRTRRACDACHANKSKCDGGTQCSLCSNRNIDCAYSRGTATSDDPAKTDDEENNEAPIANEITIHDPELRSESGSSDSLTPRISTPDAESSTKTQQQKDLESASVVIASIRTAILSSRMQLSLREELEASKWTNDIGSWVAGCVQLYFKHFHHHWPVFQAPIFDALNDPLTITSPVILIGCWLRSCKETEGIRTRELVLATHKTQVDVFLEDLSKPIAGHHDKPWPTEKHQAILLNIVLGFYTGTQTTIRRVSLLRCLFIETLRQVGMFDSEAWEHQQRVHFPGTWHIYKRTTRERWKILLACLFKMDSFLSLSNICLQNPYLQIQDLDFSLPSTFASWNSHGLDILYKRLKHEPTDRHDNSMAAIAGNPKCPMMSGMLIEDIQLGLCGTLRNLWIHVRSRRSLGTSVSPNLDYKEALTAQLEDWNSNLDRISGLLNAQTLHAHTSNYPFTAYLGDEDQDASGWEDVVQARITALVFDAKMVYHLLSLHLYSDTHMINRLAALSFASPEPIVTDNPESIDLKTRLLEWTLTMEGRRAVSHAISVLKALEMKSLRYMPSRDCLDPIAYVAVSVSAAIVWAWISNAVDSCICVQAVGAADVGHGFAGLNAGPGLEQWIQYGGLILLDRLSFCSCALGLWMKRFTDVMPQGRQTWEMSDVIAPMLHQQQDVRDNNTHIVST